MYSCIAKTYPVMPKPNQQCHLHHNTRYENLAHLRKTLDCNYTNIIDTVTQVGHTTFTVIALGANGIQVHSVLISQAHPGVGPPSARLNTCLGFKRY